MLSTIIEIESPKNRSKDERHSEDAERTTELTLEEQQRLTDAFQTLKDTNQLSQTEFASFASYLKELEKKATFENLIQSLMLGDCSIGSYNDSRQESQDKHNGDQSDSLVNIVSELNKRNICIDLPSTTGSSSTSDPANANIRQSTVEGCSNQTEGRSFGGYSHPTESPSKQPDNHLNLREFLTRELEKRVNNSPNSFDSISSSLIKSLFGSITDKQKTSTPMYDTSSTDKTINDLFSVSTVTVNSN